MPATIGTLQTMRKRTGNEPKHLKCFFFFKDYLNPDDHTIQILLNSDWLKRVQLLCNTSSKFCNTSANYKWVLIGSITIETNESQLNETG